MSDLQMSSEELTKKLILTAWSDSAFKKELIENPKAAIEKELNTKLPDDVNVKVVEIDNKTLLLPIPVKPEGELTEEQLESVAGGLSFFDYIEIEMMKGIAKKVERQTMKGGTMMQQS